MEAPKDNKKRIRRTNAEIDRDIMRALMELVEEVGFANITLTSVLQKAKMEPHVIYNKFGDLSNLLDKFVERYDYWVNETIINKIDKFNESNHEELLRQILNSLAKALYENKVMQQILIWEVSDRNTTTIRAAKTKEKNAVALLEYFDTIFENTGINFRAISALIVGGIYYLILRRECSEFCGVDFSSKAGKKELLKSIDALCRLVFSVLKQKQKIIDIVKKMKEKGMDDPTISYCTNLTVDEINLIC